VSTKSNYKVYAYIVKHNYILGGMLFTICKARLHVSAKIFAIFSLYNENLSISYTCVCRGCFGCWERVYVRDLASVGVGGTLDLGWLGTIYRQRTMPAYNCV
jgi:hypothetical protein